MRLTLRTMLAYLDEILEPEDQEEIGRKINESEFASELVRRTRDVVRRLRVGVPELSGPAAGLDVNTVAEYLDNATEAEGVADFEKVCLESDVHLAEVAACHQILTLVLGQPADVDAAARERMYRIGEMADGVTGAGGPASRAGAAGTAGGALSGTAAAAATDSESKARRRPEVPDYLRESSTAKWARAAAVLLVVGALTVLGVMFSSGRLGRHETVADVPAAPLSPADRPTDSAQQSDSGAEPARRESPADQTSDSAAATGDTAGGTSAAATTAEPPAAGTELEGARRESGPSQPEPDLPDGGSIELPAAADSPPGGPAEVEPSEVAPTEPEVAEPEPPGPEPPGPEVAESESTGPAAAKRMTSPASPLEADASASADGPDAPPVPPAPVDPDTESGPIEVGKSANGKVLLRSGPDDETWWRLAPRVPVFAGDKLLALPTFRPIIELNSDLTLEMAEGTAIHLHDPAAEGVPQIEIAYGRLVVRNADRDENRLILVIDNQRHVVQFEGSGATVAVQLVRETVAGADPTQAVAPVQVDWYVTKGRIQWQVGDTSLAGEAPARWVWSDAAMHELEQDSPAPAWIDPQDLGGIDQRASSDLDNELSAKRPAPVVLQELVDRQRSGRKIEVKSLAARCAVYVGIFDSFVEALGDPDERPAWRPLHIATLRDSLALGPEVATAIREAFIRTRGEKDGVELFRMLWGYSPEELDNGDREQLVSYLEHERLDYRLLALWNLIDITGYGNASRLDDPKRMRGLVGRWKQRLKEGEIIPKDEP